MPPKLPFAEQCRGNECRKSLSSPLTQSNGVRSHFIAFKTQFFLCVFSVSYLRGKRVTTLSNRRETGAQFTTHGTLSEGGLPSRTWQRFHVLLRPTRQRKLSLADTQTEFKILLKKIKVIGPQQRNMCLSVCQ